MVHVGSHRSSLSWESSDRSSCWSAKKSLVWRTFSIALYVSLGCLAMDQHLRKLSQKYDTSAPPESVSRWGPNDRCWEEEFLDRVAPEEEAGFVCKCPNPTIAIERNTSMTKFWRKLHRQLVDEANTDQNVDVVFIGDSITERFRGTWLYGRKPVKDTGTTFQHYFNRTMGGNYTALALGSTGDIAVETLYHLQNGMLPKSLNPRAFVLMIGTNDLDRKRGGGCSKRNALKAILNVAHFISDKKPGIPLIIHGILPRDGPGGSPGSMGVYWEKIRWINRHLKEACQAHQNWHYFAYSNLLMDGSKLHRSLMQDGVHPNTAGYQMWAPRIVKNINRVLKRESRKANRN